MSKRKKVEAWEYVHKDGRRIRPWNEDEKPMLLASQKAMGWRLAHLTEHSPEEADALRAARAFVQYVGETHGAAAPYLRLKRAIARLEKERKK